VRVFVTGETGGKKGKVTSDVKVASADELVSEGSVEIATRLHVVEHPVQL